MGAKKVVAVVLVLVVLFGGILMAVNKDFRMDVLYTVRGYRRASVCDIARDPAGYDGKKVVVQGILMIVLEGNLVSGVEVVEDYYWLVSPDLRCKILMTQPPDNDVVEYYTAEAAAFGFPVYLYEFTGKITLVEIDGEYYPLLNVDAPGRVVKVSKGG